MTFFTDTEFKTKYIEYAESTIPTWQIEAVCEIIFSQVGLIYRDASWDTTSVPLSIKNASMEQMRFMFEHDIPFVDFKDEISAGDMKAKINSDYSTLALRMLANGDSTHPNGYTYRGNPLNQNMGLDLPFGN